MLPSLQFETNATTALHLTIYDHGTAVIHEQRQVQLNAGISHLQFADVAALLDPASVLLRTPEDAAVRLLEQDFLYDLGSRDAMLKRSIGAQVRVTLTDGTQLVGVLRSRRQPAPSPNPLAGRSVFAPPDIDNHIAVEQEDGQLVVVPVERLQDLRFPTTPTPLVTTPTLRWLLHCAAGGTVPMELTYRTNGLNWSAHYNLLLAPGERTLDLHGWLELHNHSGARFADARLQLAAAARRTTGQSARGGWQPPSNGRGDETRRALPAPNAKAEGEDLHLYTLEHPVTLERDQTRQVHWFAAAGIAAQVFFLLGAEGSFPGYDDQPSVERAPTNAEIVDVHRVLVFSLPSVLPSGRITVYQQQGEGGVLLLNEGRIQHTAPDEPLRITLGKAAGLTAARTQRDFRPLSRILLEETYELRITNTRVAEPVDVYLHETLYRWRDWEILSASHEYTQINSSTIEFCVSVGAGETAIVEYTVRYILPG